MNVTRNQWFAIIGVVLSALMTSTAFLTDTYGATAAKEIVGFAGFANMILTGIAGILSGQVQQVKDVQAMPGVEQIAVNKDANSTLANMAVTLGNPKVVPLPEAVSTLKQTASGS